MTDNELWKCLILGGFKWYRKRKGGTWCLVNGVGKPIWLNREPYSKYVEITYEIERY